MFEEHKRTIFIIATIIYATISLYILFKGTPKSFEKYSLATNFLLLFGLFIMIAYALFQNITSNQWMLIGTLMLVFIIATITFYGLFNIPILSDTATLIFNILIFTSAVFLIYKYIIQRFLKIQLPVNLQSYSSNLLGITGIVSIVGIIYGVTYWLYPKIERKFEQGKMLLREPVHLSEINNIAQYNDLNPDLSYNYHYSVSFWTFIHNQSKKYKPIFNYGGKPLVEYNGEEQMVRISMKDNTKKKIIYKGKLLPQKWTNFVITYDRGIVDVFIDGTLVASEEGIVPYMEYDTMSVGENGGASGGIGYVVYYSDPIRKSVIDYNYNKYKKSLGTFI